MKKPSPKNRQSRLAIALPLALTLPVLVVIANDMWDDYETKGDLAAPDRDQSGIYDPYKDAYLEGNQQEVLPDDERYVEENSDGEPYEENEEELYPGDYEALDEAFDGVDEGAFSEEDKVELDDGDAEEDEAYDREDDGLY